MIIQEVSSAQKLFPIVRQNQISSVVKFINQWRHVSAIKVHLCNHFLQHHFSPRKTSQRIQQRWLLFSVDPIGKLARANDGISWKNPGTTTTAKILEQRPPRRTIHCRSVSVWCRWSEYFRTRHPFLSFSNPNFPYMSQFSDIFQSARISRPAQGLMINSPSDISHKSFPLRNFSKGFV